MFTARKTWKQEISEHVEKSLPKTATKKEKTEVVKQVQKHVQSQVSKNYGVKQEKKNNRSK